MLAVKNFFSSDRKSQNIPIAIQATPNEAEQQHQQRFSRMPEVFMRSIRRRSLRTKRAKSLVVADKGEKRKSDSFVNSFNWTLSNNNKTTEELNLGIIGTSNTGKKNLIETFLNGCNYKEQQYYDSNKNTEDKNFKYKAEIRLENQSYSLLIYNKKGDPDEQFSSWVDAIIFVFSLENEESFHNIINCYNKILEYRNSNLIPIILVGTQDAITDTNPRLIDETQIKKLISDLNNCNYYETCSRFGINVDRVFYEVCRKILEYKCMLAQMRSPIRNSISSPSLLTRSSTNYKSDLDLLRNNKSVANISTLIKIQITDCSSEIESSNLAATNEKENCPPKEVPNIFITPPEINRKSRRKSNLFLLSGKKLDEKYKLTEEIGIGRSIPIKQGYLYKKSGKLNKEWKRKYVTLCENGTLTYYNSLNDYIENIHEKVIKLQLITVKIPGQNPRGSNNLINSRLQPQEQIACESDSEYISIKTKNIQNLNSINSNLDLKAKIEPLPLLVKDDFLTPNLKKRRRRTKRHHSLKQNNNNNCGENEDVDDGFEFYIVSRENRQWCFEAVNTEERDDWVNLIEREVFNSLQAIESKPINLIDEENMITIRKRIAGNEFCVDCNAPNPDWASLNLGVLMCIECAGIHRNMGSHISKVRSLDLDNWSEENIKLMLSIGNNLANAFWESSIENEVKPNPTASYEDKENWIRNKYENKKFLRKCNEKVPGEVNERLIDHLLVVENCLV